MKSALDILLIEDNADHELLFRDTLELTYFNSSRLQWTKTFFEGEALLKSENFDIVFLDLSLPDSQTKETLEKIKTLTPYCPVVVLTSLDDKETILEVIKMGADDCLPKSDISDTLLERIIQFTIDRRETRQKLKESETRFHSLAENIPGIVYRCTLDSDWTMHYINDNVELLTGYSKHDFIQNAVRSFASIIHTDDVAYVDKTVNMRVSKHATFTMEYRLVKRSGESLWVHEKGKAVYDSEGNALWLEGIIIDINEKKLLEQQLEAVNSALEERVEHEVKSRVSEALTFKNIINSTKELIVYLDFDFVYRYANKQYCYYHGLDEDSVIGKNALEVLSPEVVEKLLKPSAKKVKQGQDVYIESRVAFKGVGERDVEISLHPYRNGDQHAQGMIIAIRDISEKKALEDEKERNEKLLIQQSKLAAMGEMIGAIAHQWRQPLNAVAMIVQDFEEEYKYGSFNEEYLAKGIEKSMKQIEFMSRTIDDFRNFFKPTEEGGIVDVVEVVNSTLELFGPQTRNNSIACAFRYDRSETYNTLGNANQLREACLNVVSNAIDAIKTKQDKLGRESFEAKLWVTLQKKEDELILRFEDNGIGSDKLTAERVFEPYFTTKDQGKGTGIGLYMVKIIIESNFDGSVKLEKFNDGFALSFRLPAADEY